MLKSVTYALLLLTTAIRFVDILYLLSRDSTNLPVPVIIVTSALVLYGLFLGVKKFVSTVFLRQLLLFFVVQSLAIVFNLVYVSVATPLQLGAAETIAVGTFLDLLINAGVIFLMMRRLRSFRLPVLAGMSGDMVSQR